ncbi:MAG: 2-oxo acid dehydrogenase subunit E2 [Candidatus Promineofilum sp.]|nr:2-oxo acid dehydrogenase subunit E2 [Promineifilum sp.]
MADYIVMPKLGFDMREGVLNNWLKQVGDTVNRGDVVAEIESDKATLELEAQVAGVLLHTLHGPGDVVPVGANLAIVGQAGEDVSGLVGGNGGAAAPAPAATATTNAPLAAASAPAVADKPAVAQAETAPQTQAAPAAEESYPPAAPSAPAAEADESYPGGVRATPVARRLAEEKQVDLLRVTGSGPDGRIRRADVEAFLAAPPAAPAATTAPTPAPAAAPAAAPPAPVAAGPDSEEIALTRLRQAIGRRMVESKTTVPHFYVTTEVDMGAALALRKQINETLPDEQKVSVNDLIVKAAALALRDFPNLNAAFAGDKIVRHKRISVGSAVAVEGGLLTVVQKDTDTSTLSKVAADNRAMIARAREGKMKPDDVEGGTFTVSNLGAFDVDHFIAIINPPDAAILAVGSAREVPVVVNGQLAVGTRMKGTISADHRVTDGAEAARFMQRFKALLEQPMRLLV